MTALTGEQVAQVLYQAGFRGQDLINFVGLAGRESGWTPSAHRTDNPGGNTGDFGLLQINYVNWPAVSEALGLGGDITALLDPLTNARAAFYLFQKGGMQPWFAGQSGWAPNGRWDHNVNLTRAAEAVQRASIQGLLGSDFSDPTGTSGNYSGGYGAPGGVDASMAGPMTLPADAVLYNNGFTVVAVFDVGGVKIGYHLDWNKGTVKFDPAAVTNVSSAEWDQMGVVDGGNAEELRNLSFGTYREFFDSIVTQVMGSNNPARNDPEVLRVLAEFAGRPDMTTAELQNKLQATTWYQTHTQDEMAWNSLPDAEKAKRRDEMAARMVATWFEFTGESLQAGDPRIQNYLERVASGGMGYGSWTESVVKVAATQNGESPWSRQVRDEQEQQRQRGVDVENTAQRIRDLARRWGVQWSDRTYQEFAQKIKANEMSDADVLKMLQDQAAVLYQWKDPAIETMTAATPWTEAYARIMEQPADLFNPKVQAALTAGTGVWEFEQQLKRSEEWLGTKNGRSEMFGVMAEAGRRMGFN